MNCQIFTLALALTWLIPCACQARYVNTDNGRFTTMDTYAGNSEEPLSLHKYLYAEDEPVDGSDPSGNQDAIEEVTDLSTGGIMGAAPNTVTLSGTVANIGALDVSVRIIDFTYQIDGSIIGNHKNDAIADGVSIEMGAIVSQGSYAEYRWKQDVRTDYPTPGAPINTWYKDPYNNPKTGPFCYTDTDEAAHRAAGKTKGYYSLFWDAPDRPPWDKKSGNWNDVSWDARTFLVGVSGSEFTKLIEVDWGWEMDRGVVHKKEVNEKHLLNERPETFDPSTYR